MLAAYHLILYFGYLSVHQLGRVTNRFRFMRTFNYYFWCDLFDKA